MFLSYKPEGQAEEQRWLFIPGKLRVAEMEAIERRTGWDYGTEYLQKLLQGNASARRALLWTMLRREHHTLRYEDVDFAHDELTLEQDHDELIAQREQLLTLPGINEQERAIALSMLDVQMEQAPEPPGKAQPNDAAPATG